MRFTLPVLLSVLSALILSSCWSFYPDHHLSNLYILSELRKDLIIHRAQKIGYGTNKGCESYGLFHTEITALTDSTIDGRILDHESVLGMPFTVVELYRNDSVVAIDTTTMAEGVFHLDEAKGDEIVVHATGMVTMYIDWGKYLEERG